MITGLAGLDSNISGSTTRLNITGRVRSDKVIYRKVPFTDLVADFIYDGSKVDIRSFEGTVIGGRLKGSLLCDISRDRPRRQCIRSSGRGRQGEAEPESPFAVRPA